MTTTPNRGAASAAAFSASLLLGPLVGSPVAHAGPIPPPIVKLVLEGDLVDGIGNVTAVDAVSVNGAGQWLVEVDTNFADTNTDGAVLSAEGLFVREGEALALPAGATIDSFDSVWLNNAGAVAWNLFLAGPPSNQDSGLFVGTALVLQEGSVSGAPQFSAGTPYIGFFETRAIDDGRFLVVASVDDPAIASSVDRALVWFEETADAAGFTEQAIAKEGDFLGELADAVVDFGTSQENFAINNAGQALWVASLTGAAATNGAVFLDGDVVARKGDVSPEAGFTYSNIGTSTRVDLNEAGDWVMVTGLSGDAATNQIIVRNGATVIRKGDPAPGIAGETITGFGNAPVRIADDGDVVWFATLSGDAATNQVLYKGTEVVVRKGVSTVDGLAVTTIAGTTATGGIGEGFTISRDGRFILFRGVLNADLVGAFLVDLAPPVNADLDGDGDVDGADLGILLAEWGPCPLCLIAGCAADLNGDCVIDGADLGLLLGEWT